MFGRVRCICDVEAIVTASRDFVSVFVDVSDFLCGCGRQCLSSLLHVVSSGLCSCMVSLTCSRHPSRVDLVCLTQTALPSIFLRALCLFAVSSYHRRHGSQHLLCFSSHHLPIP